MLVFLGRVRGRVRPDICSHAGCDLPGGAGNLLLPKVLGLGFQDLGNNDHLFVGFWERFYFFRAPGRCFLIPKSLLSNWMKRTVVSR